jgi:hypothetical protein
VAFTYAMPAFAAVGGVGLARREYLAVTAVQVDAVLPVAGLLDTNLTAMALTLRL